MPSDKLKVSIITPSFNQGNFLEETILSVLNQSYKNVEYIIIDGGSHDHSVDIIKKYENRLKYWVSEPDKGQSNALNKGIEKTSGDLFAWINSDDYYEKTCFDAIVNLFEENPDIDLIAGNARAVHQDGTYKDIFLAREPHYLSLLFHVRMHKKGYLTVIPHQPSVFMRKRVIDKIGKLDETLHYGMDYDLWLSCIEYGFQFKIVNDIFSNYRFHDDSKSNAGWESFYKEWEAVSNKHLSKKAYIKRLLAECWWLKKRFFK